MRRSAVVERGPRLAPSLHGLVRGQKGVARTAKKRSFQALLCHGNYRGRHPGCPSLDCFPVLGCAPNCWHPVKTATAWARFESPELSGLGVRVNGSFGNVKNFADFPGGLASRDQGQYFTRGANDGRSEDAEVQFSKT